MASIRTYKTSKGELRREVRWRESGRDLSRSFSRLDAAKRFKTDVENRLQLGVLYRARPERLGDFQAGWLDRYEQDVRPATFERARSALGLWGQFSGTRLDLLRAPDVDDHVRAVARRAPRQAEMALAKLKQMLKDAQARGQMIDLAILALKAPAVAEREPRFLAWH